MTTFDAHINLGYSTVAVAPSPALSGTSMTLATGAGALLPAAPFNITVWPASTLALKSNAEIIRVLVVVGDQITSMTRAQEGTSARAITAGDQVAVSITAKVITDLEAAINARPETGFTTTTQAGSLVAGTHDTLGLKLGIPAYLTTAALSQDSSRYAGTNGAITGGSITVNTSGISVNLPPYISTQSTQFIAMTLGGNVAGTSTFHATNNPTIFLHGGNNITLSGNGSSITISGANLGGAQTGISGVVVSDATYTSGTISFSNQNGVTIGSSVNGATQYIRLSVANQSAESQSIGMSTQTAGGATAGTTGYASGAQVRYHLVPGSNITMSQSINGASGTLSIFGPSPAGGGGVNIAVNALTTYTSGTVVFSNGNGVTFGTAGQTITASVDPTSSVVGTSGISMSTDANSVSIYVTASNANGVSFGYSGGSVLTGSLGLNSIGMSTQTQGGGTAGTTGYAQGAPFRYHFVPGSNITLSQSVNGASATLSIFGTSGAAQTVESQSIGMSTQTAGGATAGTTGYASGGQVRFHFVPGSNITMSQSINGASGTLSIFAPAPGGGAQTAISGIVVSDATYTSGTVSFSNQNGVTIGSSVNGATQYIRLSVANQSNQTIGMYATGNTTGASSSTTYDARTLGTINAIGALSVGFSNGSVQMSVPATSSLVGTSGISISTNGSTISVMNVPLSGYAPFDEGVQVAGQHGQGTWHIQPIQPPLFQFDRVALPIVFSNSSNSTGSITISQWIGIYTKNASTLSLLISTSTTVGITFSGTVGNFSLQHGPRLLTIPWTQTIQAGNYWLGIASRTTSGGANASFSQLLVSDINSDFSGIFGAASNASNQRRLGLGYYSASSSQVPGSIAFSQIQGTASAALRQPNVYFQSGTA